MGLLLLSTLAYLPLSAAVILDLITPARRVLWANDDPGPPGSQAHRQARRRMGLGVLLIAGLTIIQGVVMAHAMHELGVTIGSICPAVLLSV